MYKLSQNWYLEPRIDFEYKSYQVLAYHQALSKLFANRYFFPYLCDLDQHVSHLEEVRKARLSIEQHFQGEIDHLDFKRFRLVRRPGYIKERALEELEQILDFGLQKLSLLLDEGCEALESLAEHIGIRPLGVLEKRLDSGVLLFHYREKTRLYRYDLRMVRSSEVLRAAQAVKTAFLAEIHSGMFPNFSDLKWTAIKRSGLGVGLNAFLVESSTEIPHYEAVLPFVKSYLITQAA